MIGTRGAVASFHCLIELPCLRSLAYDSAFKYVANSTLAKIYRSGEVYQMFKRHFDPFGIPMTPAVDWTFKLNSMPD